MLYTAELIVSHLQLLLLVVVLTNHNQPRWLTCDRTWRACGEYITTGIKEHAKVECCGDRRRDTHITDPAQRYVNPLFFLLLLKE